jgi:hypothetical protein
MKNTKSDKINVPISSLKKLDIAKVFIGENSFVIIYAENFMKESLCCGNDAKFTI